MLLCFMQQDYIMLAALDETEEIVDGGKKGAIDDLKDGELEAFIKSLGVSSYSKKFLVAADEEEEGEAVEGEQKLQKKEKVNQKEVNKTTVAKKKTK